MNACEITGDAAIQDRDGELVWLQADSAIHVSAELLDTIDERGKTFFEATYEIGEWCPWNPTTKHARRRT